MLTNNYFFFNKPQFDLYGCYTRLLSQKFIFLFHTIERRGIAWIFFFLFCCTRGTILDNGLETKIS